MPAIRAADRGGRSAPTPQIPMRPRSDVACLSSEPPRLTFSMAYQPIVDVVERRTIAYEALVRGLHNEPAATVLAETADDEADALVEQRCGTLAVEIAASLGIQGTGADLYINSSPNSACLETSCLLASIEAAERAGLPLDRLILEITEGEPFRNPEECRQTLEAYRRRGVRIAIDDFGSGFAGLSTLAAFQPDITKIDIALTRGIHVISAKRTIVRAVLTMCRDLGVQVIAEGVEEDAQRRTLEELGVRYMQGNFFGEPGFEMLPVWPG